MRKFNPVTQIFASSGDGAIKSSVSKSSPMLIEKTHSSDELKLISRFLMISLFFPARISLISLMESERIREDKKNRRVKNWSVKVSQHPLENWEWKIFSSLSLWTNELYLSHPEKNSINSITMSWSSPESIFLFTLWTIFFPLLCSFSVIMNNNQQQFPHHDANIIHHDGDNDEYHQLTVLI